MDFFLISGCSFLQVVSDEFLVNSGEIEPTLFWFRAVPALNGTFYFREREKGKKMKKMKKRNLTPSSAVGPLVKKISGNPCRSPITIFKTIV